jgi:hypothetical protein
MEIELPTSIEARTELIETAAPQISRRYITCRPLHFTAKAHRS